ncbi:uncharacterized protein EV420DRAFT_1583520 [Desarmillaria tabescens]|uniref:F-box domain-containing protein n=1 Tax=Armillaria tabescens TaxID=1929756 RepID=A0AA39JDT2_ARMTA|nr:uncharacterized protein EV420DRAFT_1583520 [Desarmillaria tabescens]KAK0439494.1 hypothetical protein EV420DRAFT_1583520 [Desarmillaria tabescens]
MLLSLPTEVIERIIYLACDTVRTALRSTCTYLCKIATPIVFETLVIDITKSHFFNSHDRTSYFGTIVSNKTFTQYVRHLHLVSLKPPSRKRMGPLDWILFKRLREKSSKDLERLLVIAIPYLTSLQSILYDGFDKRFLENSALWKQISTLPSVSSLSVHGWHGNRIPITNLPNLAKLNIIGSDCLSSVAVLIANSPNLSSLGVYHCFHPASLFPPSLLTLFCWYPSGTYSFLTELSLCGNFTLRRPEVPLLVPHLHHLRSLELCIDFIPPEFWASLQVEQIFVRQLSLTILKSEPVVFDYLCSYTGLESLFLCIRTGSRKAARRDVKRVNEKHGKTLVQQTCELPGFSSV